MAPPKPAPGPIAARVGPGTPVRSIGPLPLTVWREVLTAAGSPMLSEVDVIVRAAGQHGAMCLAQAYKESSLGKDATAQRTHNPYGIMYFDGPCTFDMGEPVFGGKLCLRKYPTWAKATEHYARIISDADPPYDPESITLEEYLAVYVGGPGCRSSRGAGCASGETWKPGGSASAGSINLYIWQTVDRINGWLKGITPVPPPQPARDPLEVIMGGRYDVTHEWAVESGLGYYQYGLGHGLNGHQHTGIDVAGNLGQAMYAPGAGVVTCAGTGNGPGSWGTGCAAFADLMGHGAGRVEIMLDSGVSVILGHSSEALVRAGQRVKAGEKVATCGGMNGPHVHVEARIAGPNVYTIVDPRKHLKGQPGPPPPPQFPDLPDWLDEATFLLALPDARPDGPVTKLVIDWINFTGELPWKLAEVETADGWLYVFNHFVVKSDGQTARLLLKPGAQGGAPEGV